jgi:hypothetical protein
MPRPAAPRIARLSCSPPARLVHRTTESAIGCINLLSIRVTR